MFSVSTHIFKISHKEQSTRSLGKAKMPSLDSCTYDETAIPTLRNEKNNIFVQRELHFVLILYPCVIVAANKRHKECNCQSTLTITPIHK